MYVLSARISACGKAYYNSRNDGFTNGLDTATVYDSKIEAQAAITNRNLKTIARVERVRL